MNYEYFTLILLAIIIAIIAVIFSLRRPRDYLIQVVGKTYRQWRRPTEKSPATTTQWVLAGFDQQGHPLHFILSDTQLLQTEAGITLGRSPKSCELVIADDTISRCHARFSYHNQLLYLEDLNSANGTLIDERELQPFTPEPIAAGTTLILGEIQLSLTRQ